MRILSRFSLPDWSDSRLHHLLIASKLFVASPPTKASGSIVISATESSPSRESRQHRTHWCCWTVGYHFYGVCDLNTITIYPANLKLLLYFHTNQHTSKHSNSCNTNTPQRALTTRFWCKDRPELLPPPRKQLLSSNNSKYWTRWLFATNWPRPTNAPICCLWENAKFGWMSSRR